MDRLKESLIKVNGQTPGEEAKLLAGIRLNDSFTTKSRHFISALSPESQSYLLDYFMLHEDMHAGLNEEYRRCYSDYSFVVLPVHKALESYIKSIVNKVFDLPVPERAPLGSFLKGQENKIDDRLSQIEELWDISLSHDKWKERWKSFIDCWNDNRNPLLHVEGEKIATLRQAENVAGAILRELEISSNLFSVEFWEPVSEIIKKRLKERAEKLAKENKQA